MEVSKVNQKQKTKSLYELIRSSSYNPQYKTVFKSQSLKNQNKKMTALFNITININTSQNEIAISLKRKTIK